MDLIRKARERPLARQPRVAIAAERHVAPAAERQVANPAERQVAIPAARQAAIAADPMALALAAARRAAARGEVPVGAVLSDAGGGVLAVRGNAMRGDINACAHAEMLAMGAAARRRPPTASPGRLEGCDLWVTLEPCAMCAAAAGTFRVRRILFGAYDPKGGGIVHGVRVFAHSTPATCPEIIGGIREIESRTLLQDFFRDLRGK